MSDEEHTHRWSRWRVAETQGLAVGGEWFPHDQYRRCLIEGCAEREYRLNPRRAPVREVVERPRTSKQDPRTGRWVAPEQPDGLSGKERRRLTVEARERGVPWSEVAARWWSGDEGTAVRELKAWYAEHPSEDALTLRAVYQGKLNGLEGVVREVMARKHYVVGQRGVVLDASGEPLEDDGPIYEGVKIILKMMETNAKLVPGLAAPKLTAEVPMDMLEEEIATARAALAAERAMLEREGGDGGEAPDG